MNEQEIDSQTPEADFCIEIDYKKESENPSRVFHSLFELIDTFQEIDRNLVTSIDVNIEPVLLLEDIEVGSIRVWLSNKLRLIPDDSAYHIDWKPIVGQYLLKAKWAMINFLEGKTTISNADEIKPLEDEIHELAEKTEVRWLPDYTPLPQRQLLEGMQRMSQSLSYLSNEDKAKYLIPNEPEKEFNLTFNIAPENIEDLLAKEILTAENEMILKVKKPDYLGDSMWDMRHGKSIIQVSISDKDWLNKFQDRQIDIRPGDSVRAKVQIDNKYDFDGELISTHYNVSEILEVMHMLNHEQTNLFDDNKD